MVGERSHMGKPRLHLPWRSKRARIFFLMARLEPKQIVVFVGFVARQGTWVRALKLPRQAAEERKL